MRDPSFEKSGYKSNKKSKTKDKLTSSNKKSESLDRKSGGLDNSSYYDAMMNNNAYKLIEHPDESIVEYELSDHNIPQFDLHTDFFEKHFN